MTDLPPLPSGDSSAEILQALPAVSWCRLDDLALLRARGPEARSFLQSQLSNDLAQVSATHAQLSGYCSPKGRLLAVFSVSQLESADSFGLELPAELLPTTLKRLRLFVLRSKLVLDDGSREWPALGLAGPGAADILQGLGLAVPESAMATATQDQVWVLRRPGPWPRFVLRAAPDRLARIEPALGALPTLAWNDWSLAELLAGVPVVQTPTVDSFVPQTVDLDLAGGISFSKGCYPGQEIVARVHYLGRLKQRLHLARCDQPAEPGQAVLLAAGDGQAVGTVMACAAQPDGGQRLALSLQLERAQAGDLRLGRSDGPALTEVCAAAH